MKVMAAPYTLTGHLVRQGALLRVTHDDGSVGFADCHAWPEFGDEPYEKQLDALRSGRETRITRQCLFAAKLDADARREGRNLFHNQTVPKSHFLITHPDQIDPNRCRYKVKHLLYSHTLFDQIPSHALLRIDCNGKLSFDEVRKFFATLPYERIEFVEDPCPYDRLQWQMLRQEFGIPLACDRNAHTNYMDEDAFDLLILKPSRDPVYNSPLTRQKHVITSYLGHPLGQAFAAYIAATLPQTPQPFAGLMSHTAYAPNAYSARFPSGDTFIPPEGTGFGFDDLLENEPWHDLV